jgi:hypothetical protein
LVSASFSLRSRPHPHPKPLPTPPPPPYPPANGTWIYAFPTYKNGARTKSDGIVKLGGSAAAAPAGLQSRHLWGSDGGYTWQSPGAVSALSMGVVGDGVADDWKALQVRSSSPSSSHSFPSNHVVTDY